MKKTYNKVFGAVFAATKSRGKAKQAGIAAQAAFIKPLKSFHEGIPCIMKNVIGGLGSAIAEYNSTLKNSPPHLILGIQDKYTKGGNYKFLLDKIGL